MVLGAFDPLGVLHQAEPALVSLLGSEWDGWRGPRLPDPLAKALRRHPAGQFKSPRIVVEWLPFAELRCLRAWPLRRLDRLSEREQQVCDMPAAGRTHKEIARSLGVEACTVCSQMHAIHRKLEVRNRAELVALLLRESA